MEMSKTPKPRHFSDSSRERWDKNRHEQRTKSYLKKKKEEEKRGKIQGCVCMCVMSRKWCGATEKTCVHVKWWSGGSDGLQPVCLRKEIPSLAFVCTATEERAELLIQWPHLSYRNIHLIPPRRLSSPIISINWGYSILHVAFELLELCWIALTPLSRHA